MKNKMYLYYKIFHRLTVFIAVCYIGWAVWSLEIKTPEISTIIDIIAPRLLDSFSSDNPVKPTDFVTP